MFSTKPNTNESTKSTKNTTTNILAMSIENPATPFAPRT